MALNERQRRFVREYLVDLNASAAAWRAAWTWPLSAPTRFYVYFLIDPRNEEVFYVGKGVRGRMYVHARQTSPISRQNPLKVERILEIQATGASVIARAFEDGLDESSAYELEREMLKALESVELTNHAKGISTPRERARVLLHRVIPKSVWLGLKDWTAFEISLYDGVVASLRRMSALETSGPVEC